MNTIAEQLGKIKAGKPDFVSVTTLVIVAVIAIVSLAVALTITTFVLNNTGLILLAVLGKIAWNRSSYVRGIGTQAVTWAQKWFRVWIGADPVDKVAEDNLDRLRKWMPINRGQYPVFVRLDEYTEMNGRPTRDEVDELKAENKRLKVENQAYQYALLRRPLMMFYSFQTKTDSPAPDTAVDQAAPTDNG